MDVDMPQHAAGASQPTHPPTRDVEMTSSHGSPTPIDLNPTRQVSIVSWNIGGNLALNFGRSELMDTVRENDITFFQETWLGPRQQEVLAIPQGFNIFSCSRPKKKGGRLPGGGITALISSSITCNFREDLSSPDLLVLDLPNFFLISAYLPPANSKSKNWDHREAMQTLAQTVSLLCHPGDEGHLSPPKPVILMGDLNGRVANFQLPGDTALRFPRHSSDNTLNTRGRWIIKEIALAHSLAVLNGTCLEDASPGRKTSFQSKGRTVIDYAMLSEEMLERVVSLSVSPPVNGYDHAKIQLVMDVDDSEQNSPPAPAHPPPSFVPSSPIDFMLEEAMAARLTDDMATRNYYGQPFFNDRPVLAYITSHRNTPRSLNRVCAIARSDQRIDLIATPGPTPDALLTAIAFLAIHTNPNSTLVIHLDSDSVIRSLCYDVGPAYLKGSLDSSSPLALASSILRKRPGATSLVAINGKTRSIGPWKKAKQLAASPPSAPIPFIIPSDEASLPNWPEPLGDPLSDDAFPKAKVNTDLPPKLKAPAHKTRSIAQIRRDISHMRPPTDTDKSSESHRGRKRDRALMWTNLMVLRACRSTGEQWRVLRFWTDPKPRALAVTLPALTVDFRGRMNPPSELPPQFNKANYDNDARRASLLPDETVDVSPHLSFSRPFTEDDIIWAKRRIKQRPRNSARGVDDTPYHALLSIENAKLCELFNQCIALKDVPKKWLATTLVGILKPKKPASKPESYRIIALECCILKVLTLLIDCRFREWMGDVDLLPDSQNGFREGYRTNNNSFILRHCIDKAVGSGKCLAAVFVDLKNAFPSTNLPTLWVKLHERGAKGPMMDWMRVLYSRMQYRVKSGGDWSEAFTSLWGILAGDSMSPAFFDAYLSDFKPPATESDIVIGDTAIGNMELADDIIEITVTDRKQPDLTHAQQKLSYTEQDYCADKAFLEMNSSKTKCMLIGARNKPQQPLTLDGGRVPVEFVEQFPYGGIIFSSDSTPKHLFSHNYTARVAQAHSASYSVFAAESFVGTLSVHDGVAMYYARVDPYLIHGFEAVIDIDENSLKLLESVQLHFLRRLLDLNPRCAVAPLLVETGVIPIRHRRLILSLRYAKYALSLSSRHYTKKAYLDSILLYRERKQSWVRDMETALRKLPHFPVEMDVERMESPGGIDDIIDDVQNSYEQYLHKELQSSRLPLLNEPHRPINPRKPGSLIRKKKYLNTIVVPAHRRAVSKLLCADHTLAIEQYRRRRRHDGSSIPVDERPCRYCNSPTESETHALFFCQGSDDSPDLVDRRAVFFNRVAEIYRPFSIDRCLRNPIRCIHFFLDDPDLAPTFGKYAYDVLEMFPGFDLPQAIA